MEDQSTYYNDLISKHFSGEATEQEVAELVVWLEADSEHQKIFTQYQKSWELLEQIAIDRKVDVDQEWKNFEKNLRNDNAAKATASHLSVAYRSARKKKLFYRLSTIAAILIILCISSYMVYQYSRNTTQLQISATNANNEGILPDGSHVTLAPGSFLTYPESFDKECRNVKFRGEGYFEISHNPEQPFIIEAGNNVRIEVLGTSFYVNTLRADSLVEIILTTGKVAVYTNDAPDKKTIMAPGDKVLISSQSNKAELTVNTDQNYMAWKSGKLVFSNTRLDEVVRQLNKVYRINTVLTRPELGDCTITATFENQSADAVLHVIEETLSLNITRHGNQVEISGNGCSN